MKRLFAVVLAAALSFCAHADSLHDIVTKGAVDRSVTVKIVDATTGVPSTDIVFNSTGIDLWYRREGAASVDVTEVTLAALTTAHTDGGFLHVNDGVYRLDLPDAAFATGANYVDFGGIVTGEIVIGGRVKLVNVNLEDAVRGGMTALPNANADAAGGLPISDAGGLDLDLLASNVAAILVDTGTTLDDFVDDLESRLGTPSNLGSGATVAANLVDIEGFADNLPADPADDSDIDAQLATLTTRLGTPVDLGTGADVASNLEDIEGFADNLPSDPADDSDIDAQLATIVADTNEVQISLAAGGLIESMVDDLQAEVDGIQADTEDLQNRVPAALVGGRIDATIDATGFESGAETDVQTAAAAALNAEDGGNFTALVTAILQGNGVPASTTIATLASQTSFTLTAGSADDNAYNGYGIVIRDASTSTQQALGCVRDYTGSTKTVTLLDDPGVFTMATTDNVALLPAYCDAQVQQDLLDTAILTCTVDTANFAGTSTTFACDLTDSAGVAVTANIATDELKGKPFKVLSGAQKYEERYVFDTTWDGTNSELQVTIAASYPFSATLADGVIIVLE